MILKRYLNIFILILTLAVIIISISAPAFAVSEEEKTFLAMYFKDEELVVLSTTRSLKSITRVAENVEVITADDIELMNAHSLADVLYNINGIQVNFAGSSPGNVASAFIQSSELRHVSVFMDGIPINNLRNNIADIGFFPVQHIEKIEVIKGPASSAWGSSLGGVVNIITKSPGNKQGVSGTVSASYGERNTGDFRAEVSGKKEKFGGYLYAGRLRTNGLRPENDVSQNNIYTKLSYDPAPNTRIFFTLLYGKTNRGDFEDREFDLFGRDRTRLLNAGISLHSALSSNTGLSVSAWTQSEKQDVLDFLFSDKSEINRITTRERKSGGSAKLTWKGSIHNVVFGSDYDEGTLKTDIIAEGKQGIRKWAVYVNDTINLGKFSVTPGLRYDNTDTNGNFASPSLGMTYELTKKTLLRAFVSRGFNTPSLLATFGDNIYAVSNPDLRVEKVWSYQAGIETGELEYLYLKLSAFRHDIKDGILYVPVSIDPETNIQTSKNVNKDRIRRQGLELELKTKPVYNTTLFASAGFVEIENRETGEEIRDMPKYGYNAGLKYDDGKSLRGIIQGNYTWWNATSYHEAKYSSFIVNANLIKTVFRKNDNKLDLFLSAHNIFNGQQYWDYYYKNAGRWIEAGVRYRF